MLLYCCADLLLKALANAEGDLDPDVVRAAAGLRRALQMTDESFAAAEADGKVGESPHALGPSSIQAARALVEAQIDEGVICPCCGQTCKLYPRVMYAGMGAWLIWLVLAYETDPRWYSIHEGPVQRGGDYGKLLHWKLVERAPNDGTGAKRTSGRWRPTPEGSRFARGETRIPSRVYIYDNTVLRVSEETVSIQDVLGEHFNYGMLMSGEFRFKE
jgi:hypothetical protein